LDTITIAPQANGFLTSDGQLPDVELSIQRFERVTRASTRLGYALSIWQDELLHLSTKWFHVESSTWSPFGRPVNLHLISLLSL
jgi:hypothetical protein